MLLEDFVTLGLVMSQCVDKGQRLGSVHRLGVARVDNDKVIALMMPSLHVNAVSSPQTSSSLFFRCGIEHVGEAVC